MVNNLPNIVPNPTGAALPGPEKGLIESLFGSKTPDAGQAVVPGAPAEAVPADFMKMLVKTQDQRATQGGQDAKAPATPASKGGTQAMESTNAWAALQQELAQAKAAANAASVEDKKSLTEAT